MSTSPPCPAPAAERRLVLRKILFAVWALALMPLFGALHAFLDARPLYRSLVGTGVFGASAVAALWFLGREKHPTLRVWRIFFVVWTILLCPVLLTIAYGIGKEGWPSGRFNRPIAHVLSLVLTLSIPAFLTGLGALLRIYRVAGVLAIVAGLASIVTGGFLFRATAPIKLFPRAFEDVLDVVAFGAKVETYLAIPIGIALIVGGIMTFRAARARTVAPSATPVVVPEDGREPITPALDP
jgi:hypothetical protein